MTENALLAPDRLAKVSGQMKPVPIKQISENVFDVGGARYDAAGKPTVGQAIAPVILGVWTKRTYIERQHRARFI